MRTERVRWLLGFFVAMFLGNVATAAPRACALALMGEHHAAIQAIEARGSEHLCPEADNATRLPAQCAQGFKSSEQGPPADVLLHALVPAPAALQVPFRPAQTAVVIAAPPFAGPPLTILFRNLRN